MSKATTTRSPFFRPWTSGPASSTAGWQWQGGAQAGQASELNWQASQLNEGTSRQPGTRPRLPELAVRTHLPPPFQYQQCPAPRLCVLALTDAHELVACSARSSRDMGQLRIRCSA